MYLPILNLFKAFPILLGKDVNPEWVMCGLALNPPLPSDFSTPGQELHLYCIPLSAMLSLSFPLPPSESVLICQVSCPFLEEATLGHPA